MFAASATLSAAGLDATVSGGAIKILSNNGTEFQLTVVSDANASFGFGIVAGTTTLKTLAETAGPETPLANAIAARLHGQIRPDSGGSSRGRPEGVSSMIGRL